MPEYLCPPMRKLNKFMEHFWLAVAIGTALAAGWVILAEGYDAGKSWLLFPAIALAMYFMRRFMRGRLEALDDRHNAKG